MATPLVENIVIDEQTMWRGGCRVIVADEVDPPDFPELLEDMIDLATMELKPKWNDLGATNEDGFTITPEWDTVDPIAIDQRDAGLRGGKPTNVRMTGSATAMDTSQSRMQFTWAVIGASVAIAAVPGTNVAQHVAPIGPIQDLKTRMVAILQQNDGGGGKLRGWAFRKAILQSPGDLAINKNNAAATEFTLEFQADSSITDGSSFGRSFEQD